MMAQHGRNQLGCARRLTWALTDIRYVGTVLALDLDVSSTVYRCYLLSLSHMAP